MNNQNELHTSPEAYLKNFNKKLFQFLKSIKFLNNAEYEKEIEDLLKKTVIAEILYNNQFITVSGLQGVGKSTILAKAYSLPDNSIPQNQERGEKLPILFTEDHSIEDGNVKKLAWKIDEKDSDYIVRKEEIGNEEFYNKCLGPSDNDLLLEIKVCKRIFDTDGISFLLLPGLEDPEDSIKKHSWQRLVEMSLILSANTVFVFNETKYADKDNADAIKLITDVFKEAKPVFCLSFSDQSKDANKGLRDTIIKNHNIPVGEIDRVISTGISNQLLKEWIPTFKNSINKYSKTQAGFRKKQVEFIDKLMLEDVSNILTKYDQIFLKSDLTKMVEGSEYQNLLDTFDDQVDVMRRDYLRNLIRALDEFSIKPIDILTDKVVDKKFFKKLINRIFGESLKEQKEFENSLKETWKNGNGFSFEEIFFNILTRVISKELYIKGLQTNLLLPISIQDNPIGIYDENENVTKLLPNNVIQNLLILSSENESNTPYESKLKETIKLLPVLALESLRIMTSFTNSSELIKLKNENSPEDFRKKVDEIVSDYEFLGNNHSKVIFATATMLGLDMADGEINSIPALLSALGVATTSTTVAVITALTGVAGVAAIAGLSLNQVNKYELEQRQFINRAISIIKDNYLTEFTFIFDDLMEKLKQRLENVLSNHYLIDKNYHKLENAKRNSKNLKEIRDQIRESSVNLKNIIDVSK